jgi:hypothetical protein
MHAPMHQVKSLCMITMRGGKAAGTRGMMKSMGTIGRGKESSMLVLDIREEDEADFLVAAGSVPKDLIKDWHGPTRAGSTIKDFKRLLYTGGIAASGHWAARVVTLKVKELMGHMEVLVGLHSTFSSDEAILIDLSTPEAAHKVANLVEDAVMVTPRLMIARSPASELQWQDKLAEVFSDDDNAFIERVRYRPSVGGGVIAVAPALKEQKERKKYAAKGTDGKELQVVVRFSGEFVGAREGEAGDYMTMIQATAGIPLKNEAVAILKDAGQWTLLRDARYGWKGDVLVKLGSEAEAIRLYAALEGKAITVPGGGRIVVEVILHIALVDAARKVRGGACI